MSRQYDTEREVSREEAEGRRDEIRNFMADRATVATYLITLRKDGRPLARPVGAFLEDWTIYTVTEDIHPKTLQIRRNPVVAYIFSGMTGRERGNIWCDERVPFQKGIYPLASAKGGRLAIGEYLQESAPLRAVRFVQRRFGY